MAYDPPSSSTRNSRALNTWWLVNAQRGSTISYDVTINASATLLAGTIGQVTLQTGTSSDGGITVTADSAPLAVATSGYLAGLVNPGGPQTVKLSGPVPTGSYARIVSTNVAGTPTYTNPSTGASNSAYGWELYNG